MTDKGHVTQQTLAKLLGVSRITVSKALRDHPDISAAMKEKVRKTAEKSGYSPNLVAANLSKGSTRTIGVVIPDLENSFFAYLTDSIIDKASEMDYRVMLTVSRENPEIENQNIRTLAGMRVDGILVCISQGTTGKSVFEMVRKLGIPMVFFDRSLRIKDFSRVVFNDMNGTINALRKLISAGYSKIAHFAGFQKISIGRERLNGYRRALQEKGISVRKDWIIEGGFEPDDGYKAFKKLLNATEMPQIILAVNDRVALGAYKAAAESGVRIPQDMGIVGYGFNETTSMFNPPLAVINQDPRKLGTRATELLLNEIHGKTKGPSKILIDEEFIWNESVKKTHNFNP